MVLLWILPLVIAQIWACTLPMFGHFGSYQAVNAMMAEMFGAGSFRSFFEPRVFSIQDGQPALHLLYIPYGAWFARLTQLGLGLQPSMLPLLGKLYSLITGFGCAFLIRVLVKRIYQHSHAANLAALLFLVTPMITVISVSFQNETWALLFMLLGLSLLLRGCETNTSIRIAAAGFFLGLSVTARIHFAFFILPALWILAKYQKKSVLGFLTYAFGFVVPMTAWIGWFYFLEKTESGVLTSLFSQVGEGRIAAAVYFKNSDFYTRLARQVLLYWTFPAVWLFAGAMVRKKAHGYLWIWLLASFSVVFLLPRKVLDHPFYLVCGIPAFCIMAAPVIERWLSQRSKAIQAGVMIVSISLITFIFLHFQILPENTKVWLNQAKLIEQNTDSKDRVVIQHDQSTAMLFYAHRLGWGFDLSMAQSDVLSSKELRHQLIRSKGYGNLISWIEYLRTQGAGRFIVTDTKRFNSEKQFAAYMRSRYSLLAASTDDFLIFDLRG